MDKGSLGRWECCEYVGVKVCVKSLVVAVYRRPRKKAVRLRSYPSR